MLTREENEALTRVGADQPMGRLLRRYWMPAALLEEIAEPGGAPVRVKLLGESLVAFRDPLGQAGLVREFCPHRGASLSYARNEAGGLRCLYHGWKMAPDGRVVDTPAEPAESRFKERLRHPAYPTVEAGGILWAYLGPAALQPPFPRYAWMALPPEQLVVVKMYQDCNYLQGVEGDLDTAHPNYLHQDFDQQDGSWEGAGWNSITELLHDGAPQIVCEDTPQMMRVVATRQSPREGMKYTRVTEWIAPFYCFTASGPCESRGFKGWLPIDDNRCYTLYIHFDMHKPLDREAVWRNWNHRTQGPDYRTPHTLANAHLQNRADMVTRNYSGILGAAIQDRAVQESMGPIYDRTQEHLGRSDKAVIYYRRTLLRLQRELEQGKPLPAQDPTLDFDLPTASLHVPQSTDWRDAVAQQARLDAAQGVAPADVRAPVHAAQEKT